MGNAGGYVDDPDDAGGETYRDISRVYNPLWIGWKVIDQLKLPGSPNIPKNFVSDGLDKMAYAFYKDKYWNPLDLDNVRNQDVANIIFDETLDGLGRCLQMVKLALSELNGKQYPANQVPTTDLNAADQQRFFECFKNIRAAHFKYAAGDLSSGDKYYSFFKKFGGAAKNGSKFEKGWLNRVNRYVWNGIKSNPGAVAGGGAMIVLIGLGLFF